MSGSIRKRQKNNWPRFLKTYIIYIAVILFLVFFLADSFQSKTNYYLEVKPPVLRSSFLPYPQPALYPIKKNSVTAPKISAISALVLDLDSWVIIYQKQSDLKLPPASTVKLATALTALDNCPPEKVVVTSQINTFGSKIKIVAGQQFTVESLLKAMLIASANDAAEQLATSCSPDDATFVEAMNKKAKDLHLTNTNFANPTGLDHPESFSSALDLAHLARDTLDNELIEKIVATKYDTIFDLTGRHKYQFTNVNSLLGYVPGVLGVKTGRTQLAKENLISLTKRANHRILTIVLGSEDRFSESQRLIEWAYQNFEWKNLF